jgi:hypothetical protein
MTHIQLALGLTVLAFVICLTMDRSGSYYHNVVDWRVNPYRTYMKLWTMFGNPVIYDESAGGCAVWVGNQLSGTYWSKIIIYDKDTDFISASVQFNIPMTMVNDVVQLDGSVTYNKLRNELSVRCDNFPCIVGITYAAVQLANSNLNTTDAKTEIKKYKQSQPTQSEYDKLSYKLATLIE